MVIIVQNAGKFFFPQRKKLRLFKENYSLDLFRKIIYAGSHSTSSFKEAQQNLSKLAEIEVSESHIHRLTTRVGNEFNEFDDKSFSEWQEDISEHEKNIEVASISVDGGRAQLREENCGTGVHNPHWVETKVGCLQILQSEESEKDPHPELPQIFQNKKSVKYIVEGLKGKKKKEPENILDESQCPNHQNKNKLINKIEQTPSYRPKVIKKMVIANVEDAESFGYKLFCKTHKKGLHKAKRKAYLGDGDRKIWTIYEDNFRAENWTPILDIVHAIEYVYEAAKLTTENENQTWAKYIKFVTHIWQGRTLTVIRNLDKTINLMEGNKNIQTKASKNNLERIRKIRNYLKNNITKMNYSEYRKEGLPISSCHVESLIKQLNLRIKSSDKFWNKTNLKGIIKIKSSLLSEDNSWDKFWEDRYTQQVTTKRGYHKNEVKLAA